MNGTKKSNKNNENICYGTTISLHGYKEFKLDMSNVLEGNTYIDLLKFMSNKQIEIRREKEGDRRRGEIRERRRKGIMYFIIIIIYPSTSHYRSYNLI